MVDSKDPAYMKIGFTLRELKAGKGIDWKSAKEEPTTADGTPRWLNWTATKTID
jgi:hypothetical protein